MSLLITAILWVACVLAWVTLGAALVLASICTAIVVWVVVCLRDGYRYSKQRSRRGLH